MDDFETRCLKKVITQRFKQTISDEVLWEKAFIFCKNLAKFIHAPVSLSDYRRMETYATDKELVLCTLNAIKDYFPHIDSYLDFDIIGHSYCVALLSHSTFYRTEIFDYFSALCDVLIKENNHKYGGVIYRNMEKLSKAYPDLKVFKEKLVQFKQNKTYHLYKGVFMGNQEIREPVQKRSIEKKQNIIKYGFELICEKGYHNTNTAEIAKAAGVSTGIVYQYFNDKRDIFLQGIEQYSKSLLFPITEISLKTSKNFDLKTELNNVIKTSVKNHKLSEAAHEEIYALQHSDQEVAKIFLNQEIAATNKLVEILENNNIKTTNITEKAHLIVSMIDSLCHEIVYHKHTTMDYNAMTEIVIDAIINILK